MKKMLCLLFVCTIMIGLLSGCIPKREEKKDLAAVLQGMYDFLDGESLAVTQTVDFSLAGRELDLTFDQTTEICFVGKGTDDLVFDFQTERSTTVGNNDPDKKEASYRYEDGVVYQNSPYIYKKKQTMSADEFLDYAGFDLASPDEIGEDILEDGKLDMKNATVSYNTDDDKQNVMKISETEQLMLPTILSTTGFSKDVVSVVAYEHEETYIFDKKDVLKSVDADISCEFTAFGENYVVEVAIHETYNGAVSKEDVPSMFGKSTYEEQNLTYLDLFAGSYQALSPFNTATIAETESFSMTSKIPEEYSYSASVTFSQEVSEKDAVFSQEGKQKTKIISPSGDKNVSSKYSYDLKKGVATSTVDGKKSVEDWKNPYGFYLNGAISMSRVRRPDDADIAGITFTEKDGKLTCKYSLKPSAATALIEEKMAGIFGYQEAYNLSYYIKDDDFTTNSGTLVVDMETGAVMSHKLSLKLRSRIYETDYPIEFSYSMKVSDTLVAAPPETGNVVTM